MQQTEVTFGQLDRVLRSLGFSRRCDKREPPAVIYDHQETGALILLPLHPDSDLVIDYHLAVVRKTLDGFGVADPSMFDAKLQKAG